MGILVHRLEPILNQIDEDLLDLNWVDLDDRALRRPNRATIPRRHD